MMIAFTASLRGTCDRRRVGCCIADPEGHILSTGYNGSSPKAPHCAEAGHLMVDGHCERTVHAEANAIGHAAKKGRALEGATAYCTTKPCITCIKDLAAAGIVRVVYVDEYIDPTHPHSEGSVVDELALAAGIELVKFRASGAAWNFIEHVRKMA